MALLLVEGGLGGDGLRLICYGGEFYVDALQMTFPVPVAFSMWTILPLSPLVPTWVGWREGGLGLLPVLNFKEQGKTPRSIC